MNLCCILTTGTEQYYEVSWEEFLKFINHVKRLMSYLANFQHPEAGFQFMTILPLIRKQRWRKIVWAENSLGLSPTALQSLGVPGQAPPQPRPTPAT